MDGPDLQAAKRLLDTARQAGFRFERIAPGPDGPLFGIRDSSEYRDTVYVGGFGEGCHATRSRKSSLLLPGAALVIERVSGDALTVLHTVVTDWTAEGD